MKWYSNVNMIVALMLVIFMSIGVSLFGQNLNVDENAIIGRWMDERGNSLIKIYKNKDLFNGRIVWLKNPYDANGNAIRDVNNINEELRNRHINGLIVLTELKYENNGQWEGGKIYVPRLGESLNCDMKLLSADTLEVNVYYGISKLGRTSVWTRQ